ncbi:hypothetical protein MA9V2_261 [Chryseobacterium phage MA9V-2]|nr:hypothetical protein MA9V2_261 [Chryseobacterium phage MA9V-2]
MAKLRFIATGRDPLTRLGGYPNVEAAKNLCKSAKITNEGSATYGHKELADGKKSYFYDHTTNVYLLTNEGVAIEFSTLQTTYVNTSQKLPLGPRTSLKEATLKIDGVPVEALPHELFLNNWESISNLVENLVNLTK